MPLSKQKSNFAKLGEAVGSYSWDRSSADAFLISLDPMLRNAESEAQISGDVKATGFTDGPLELTVVIKKDIFALNPEYLKRVPKGQDPIKFISMDPSYDPLEDADSNLSRLVTGLRDTGKFDEVSLEKDNQAGPSIHASGEQEVVLVLGASFKSKL